MHLLPFSGVRSQLQPIPAAKFASFTASLRMAYMGCVRLIANPTDSWEGLKIGPARAWNLTYETAPLHQALGCKTTDQFYYHWLNTNSTGE